ncbi:hypothetical protein D6851_07465 [Altericroceibacterium spongiae]|uniref:DUF4148 domain-containing protein n=1 Tax=Altericroceibacterium spongiae TaxID=2320269 RepID=A0A420EMM2_9SPHN|nr:hypothetical protein [Altericroceibacterium spongiae]RKF21846.1 hypothetical protein D6851_07465 [Altericroceibacterium spongiae]
MYKYSLALLMVLTAPVHAQTVSTDSVGTSEEDRATSVVYSTNDARDEIEKGRDTGTLSKEQARVLKKQATRIDNVRDRYAVDGLSDSERRDLDFQSRALESITKAQRFQIPDKRP